jgi:predicted MFS family arabinose efflux permease
LTLVDLFATQAILPSIAEHYGVSPAMAGFAVNACTIGMAASCLAIALFSKRLNRRTGICASLALLAIPTTLLVIAPDLATFATLRILQGVFMASAFTLTMTYLAEHATPEETAKVLAGYITGVVASNLIGRLASASVAGMLGLPANFYLFAALNLLGSLIVAMGFERMNSSNEERRAGSPFAVWRSHLANAALRAGFGIGFLILFVFIGTFTYVNFVLVDEPLGVSRMSLGLIYVVFLPAMFTTPLAGKLALRLGTRPAMWLGLAVALIGMPLLLLPSLPAVLAGMTLIGCGTFFAQAIGTGFVGRTAKMDRAAASGLYLASYYLGGLAGAWILGQAFVAWGWNATVIVIAMATMLAAALTLELKETAAG